MSLENDEVLVTAHFQIGDCPPVRFLHTYLARQLWTWHSCMGSILDVGCGDGRLFSQNIPFSIENDNYVCYPPEVMSIDIRPVHKLYPKCAKIERFMMASGEALPFQDKTFDTVVLNEILEHPVDPVQILLEAKRVGRKRIVITVPDEETWIKRRVFRHFSVIDSTEHVRLFNAKKLRTMLETAGLTMFQVQHQLFGMLEYYVAQVTLCTE